MYSWGPDTSGWAKPGGYKFDSARAPYLDKLAKDASAKGPRSYSRAKTWNAALVDPKGKEISTDSSNPLVVAIDVTGSMASWPGEIFDRLPLMYQTLSQYKPDVEIAFCAIGDATCDSYPLQVNNFGKGVELEDHVKALCAEGGGGGQVSESYELFGHFANTKIKMPNAKSPFLLVYGDEKFYNQIAAAQVKHYMGDTLNSDLDSESMWKGVLGKFNLFFMHKPYGYGGEANVDREVVDHWAAVIGRQRIIELPSYERAVDVGIGLIAKQWGEFGDFGSSLSSRQIDPNVRASVYHSLRHIADPSATNSVMDRSASKKSIPLDKLVEN